MQTGTKISGTAHLLLLGWAAFGGSFDSDPLPFEVQDVSIITAEQFAAMTASMQVPDATATPVAPSEPTAEAPEINAEPDQEPTPDTPEPVSQPIAEVEPDTPPDQPTPEAEAAETPEETAQPPAPDVVFEPVEPGPEDRPQPRPVDRVAPEPVVAPPPDTTPDVEETPPVTANEGAETPQEPAEATAPEEATDQIVTEADEPVSLAPTRSPRPPSRPTRRPAAPATETATNEPSESPDPTPTAQTGVNDALAEALGNNTPAAPAPAAPTGPPLTGGEKDALRVAVSSCWNVGSLSSAALQTTVVVGVSMSRDGKPEAGSIRMLSSSGGPDAAARQAYEAARRAIIRCGARGFNLPDEKYSQWRDIEMTFNPERMRIK